MSRRAAASGTLTGVLLPALTGFLVIRSVLLLAVLRLRPADPDVPQGLLDALLTPAGRLVGTVATDGYGSVIRRVDAAAFSDTALFWLQPALARLAAAATGAPLTPSSLEELALGVSFIASVAAAAAVCLLTQAVYGDRAAVTATWVWAALPMGASLWTGAPYAVLAACSVGSLLAWTSGRAVLAGGLAGAAASADPVGIGAVVAVLVGLGLRARPDRLPRGVVLATAALALVPPAAYATWLARRRGDPAAFLTVLSARGEAEDGTRRVRDQFVGLIDSPAIVLVALVAAALALGLVLAVTDRQPPELIVHGAVTLLVAGLVAPSLAAAGALSLVAIGLWLPLGDAVAARPRTQQVVVGAVLLLTALAWTSSGIVGSPWG